MANYAPDVHTGAGPSRIPAELEAFFKMAERWDLSIEEQILLLGSPAARRSSSGRRKAATCQSTRESASPTCWAYGKALRILFTVDERGEEWIRRKNRYFDGASALDVMLEGKVNSLYRVQRYLDAQRGG